MEQEITACESPFASPSARAPLEDLLPIAFTDLRLGAVHRGSVIIATISSPAILRGSTVWSRLHDERGRSITMAVRNALPPDCSSEDARELFPQGTKLAVQEPYFSRYDENAEEEDDSAVGLRVDDPCDLVFLTADENDLVKALFLENHHRLDHARLRIEGNDLFVRGDWLGAARCYSRSITAAEHELGKNPDHLEKNRKHEPSLKHGKGSSSSSCMEKLAKTSLSLCSCKDDAPVAASGSSRKPGDRHGESPRSILKGLVSAYSNRAESYLRMGRSTEALGDAEAALRIEPGHVKSLYRKGRALHCMQKFGEAVRCFQEAAELSPGDLDVQRALEEGLTCEKQSRGIFELGGYFQSEFTSNTPQCVEFVGPVQVRRSDVAGRGLFLTQDVGAGELLLVSNPLGIARVSSSADPTEELVAKLYTRVRTSEDRERIFQQLGCLFNGTQRSCERLPDMDLVSGRQQHGRENNAPMDVGRIRRLVRWNAFDERGFATHNRQKKSSSFSAGIWFLPSFINHSCLPNVSRIHVGDAMLVRAARDLKAGEELFHPYTDIARPLRLRRDAVFNGWGFQCSCPRCCLEERLDEPLKAAAELYTALDGGSGNSNSSSNSTLSTYMSWDKGVSTSEYVVRSVRECNRVEAAVCGLDAGERMWIRASFTLVFLMAASAIELQNRAELVNAVRQAVVYVSPGDPQTLKLAAMVAEELRLLQGADSEAYKAAEAIAVQVCEGIFGRQEQLVTKVLIGACMRGSLDG